MLKRDQKDVFRFATLQSELGKEYLIKYRVDRDIDSVVLIENNNAYTKSTAAFRILKTLGGFMSIFYGLIIIPTFVRNFFYDLIAKYRYRWFGKANCEFVPHDKMKNKFLIKSK